MPHESVITISVAVTMVTMFADVTVDVLISVDRRSFVVTFELLVIVGPCHELDD